MMFQKKFIYECSPLVPREDLTLGRWGFCIELDGNFAHVARQNEMTEFARNRFLEIGREIIGVYFPKHDMKLVHPPYHFVADSWLLQYVQVPGDACDLGFDQSALHEFCTAWQSQREVTERFPVNYGPHNVDNSAQAFCLQALWLNWANSAAAVLHEKF